MQVNQTGAHAKTKIRVFNDVQGDQRNYYGPVIKSYFGVPSETTSRYLHKHILPSPPALMVGRDKEKAHVVKTLLQDRPARVVILGGNGMGKTTLALSILHEAAITDRYPSRFFVSCEGVVSTSSLVEEIANALQIPPANRDSFLVGTIFSLFSDNKTLLCLDNFETLWDNVAIRPDIEAFLSKLQPMVQGLIIIMHGAQRPSRVTWSRPLLPPLQPLTTDDSRLIFKGMTEYSIDEFVEKLLVAVEGVPLAISLVSTLLQEGHESSKSLWSRWTKTQSNVLESGGKHSLSNLNTSFYLSVYGPRIQADPTSVDILAMLSVLPDGFPDDERALEELQSHLPAGYDLQKTLLTLRRASLIHVDESTAPRRLRMLSPVQSFCRNTLKGSEELRNGITSYYVQFLIPFKHIPDRDTQVAIIPSEMHNVQAVLVEAWRRGKGDASVMAASLQFTLWSTYLGNPVEEVLRAAMEGVVVEPNSQGDPHHLSGNMHGRQDELDNVFALFRHAAELHRQAHDIPTEATDSENPGPPHPQRDELDDAEAMFKRAAELYQQTHPTSDEGHNLLNLRLLHVQKDIRDEAEAMFQRAVEYHRRIYNISEEGNDLQRLAEAHLEQNKPDEAKAMLTRAAELHREVRDVLQEGEDLQTLGWLHLTRNELDEAEAMLTRAAELHRQAGDICGVEVDLETLEVVHSRQSERRQIANTAS